MSSVQVGNQSRNINQSKIPKKNRLNLIVANTLAVYAVSQICFIIFLWFNHVGFPLNLEAMELTRLQHLDRLLNGLPLYLKPSSDFIALAYNPLSYLLTVPFTWLFGSSLFTMRLFAIFGMLGAGIVTFLSVRQHTKSNWWGLMAVGLFAAAYRVMDTYLDNAHADSWLLFSILLGCYLIDQNRSQLWNVSGILCFLAGFWFKQQGAIFVIGAVLFLTWRDGFRKALLAWLLAIILGPFLYWNAPKSLLGDYFHYYTWQVPRQWMEFSLGEVRNLLELLLRKYPILLAISAAISTISLIKCRRTVSIWYFMYPFALTSAVSAVLTPGSNDNVYIPMGSWLIIIGTIGIKQFRHQRNNSHGRLSITALVALVLCFALFIYNPASVIINSSQSHKAYADLISYLKTLDGPVFAPGIGQLPDSAGYKFYPSIHAVPLNDIIRRPGVDQNNHPVVRQLLEPVIHPHHNAYILYNYPLEDDPMFKFLTNYYEFIADIGKDTKSLKALPKHYSVPDAHYLYRYKHTLLQ